MNPSAQADPRFNRPSPPQRRHSLATTLPAAGTAPETKPVLKVASRRLEALALCTPQAPVCPDRAPRPGFTAIPYFMDKALIGAFKCGQTGFAAFLISSVISPNSFSENKPILCKFARDGHLGLVRLLIESGAEIDAHARGSGYDTPLLLAAEAGHLDVVEYLLSQGAKAVATGPSGYTALMFAAQKKHLDMVTFLAGTNKVNDVNAVDCQGRSALMFAVKGGDAKVVNFLCGSHASVNHTSGKGKSVLMYAAQARSAQVKEIIDILLGAGAQINQGDQAGNTALMRACNVGNAEAVHALLDAGADIDVGNAEGRSALWFAVYPAVRNNVKTTASIIETLARRGADWSKIDPDGQVADFLRDRLADVHIDSPDSVAKEAEGTGLRVMVAGRPCSPEAFFSTLADEIDREKLSLHVPYFDLPAWFTSQGWSSPVVSLIETAFKEPKILHATLHAIATPGMVIPHAQKLALYAAVFANLRFQQAPYANSGFSDAAVSRMRQRAEAELATLVEIANHADAGLRACLGNLFADCLTACPEHNSLKAALLSVLLQTQAGLIAPLAELVVSSWLAALEQTGSVADMEGNADGAGGPERLQALKTAFIVSFRKLLDSQAVFENMRGNIANARTHMPRSLGKVEINHVAYEDLMVRQIQYLKDYFEALSAADLASVLPEAR